MIIYGLFALITIHSDVLYSYEFMLETRHYDAIGLIRNVEYGLMTDETPIDIIIEDSMSKGIKKYNSLCVTLIIIGGTIFFGGSALVRKNKNKTT